METRGQRFVTLQMVDEFDALLLSLALLQEEYTIQLFNLQEPMGAVEGQGRKKKFGDQQCFRADTEPGNVQRQYWRPKTLITEEGTILSYVKITGPELEVIGLKEIDIEPKEGWISKKNLY
eukprot:Gb_25280 [translate_table: standard]